MKSANGVRGLRWSSELIPMREALTEYLRTFSSPRLDGDLSDADLRRVAEMAVLFFAGRLFDRDREFVALLDKCDRLAGDLDRLHARLSVPRTKGTP